jgi:hypothetical protein
MGAESGAGADVRLAGFQAAGEPLSSGLRLSLQPIEQEALSIFLGVVAAEIKQPASC